MANVKIVRNDNLIYHGNILEIPIKKDSIIQKSIEVFDDDDPCIIHKSYVVKLFVDELLEKTNLKNQREVELSSFINDLDFLDFTLEDSIITYEE